MELMIALLIIGILLSFAVPSIAPTAIRNNIVESADLIAPFKQNIALYYSLHGKFPANNAEAGMPEADKIIGNFLVGAEVEDGAIHLHLGNKIQKPVQNTTLSLRPIYVEGSPKSPISWVCGNDEIPAGMTAAGPNNTDIVDKYLPLNCR